MKNSSVPEIHLTAICGTGMASLAGLLKEKGHVVSGSDANVYPPMSDQLAALGIPVQNGYRPENIGQPDLVIIGNAVSKTNEEVQEILRRGLPYYSMPQAVGELFLKERYPLVVAGTHGKTTTSALLAWSLERTGQAPGFLVGGILKNFGKSYQLGTGDYFVVEGDEYDSAFFDKGPKFLHYRPKALILNPVEFDHADIYRDLAHVMEAFSKLVRLLPKDGLILACSDSPNVLKLIADAPCRVLRYGLQEGADLTARDISLDGSTRFRLLKKGQDLGEMISPLLGRHNIQNLLGVLGVLLDLGIHLDDIRAALLEFQGVKRRQEILAEIRGITVMDDFAHHPTAVMETLAALRSRYPSGRLWAIFEPRSNTTRRKVFQNEFLGAFDSADEIIFAAPYLSEKIPEEDRLDPGLVVEGLKKRGKSTRYIPSVDAIVDILAAEARSGDVLCFMSNGGFGGVHAKTVEKLKQL